MKESSIKVPPIAIPRSIRRKAIIEVDVGEYEFETFDDSSARQGTRIIADDVHPTFVRTFTEFYCLRRVKAPPLDWGEGTKECRKFHISQEMGDYWRCFGSCLLLAPYHT